MRDDIRTVVAEEVIQLAAVQGQRIEAVELHDGFDLLLSGLIDSLGVLELTAALEERCGFEIDFDAIDPEQLTVFGPLCDFVAAEAAKQPA